LLGLAVEGEKVGTKDTTKGHVKATAESLTRRKTEVNNLGSGWAKKRVSESQTPKARKLGHNAGNETAKERKRKTANFSRSRASGGMIGRSGTGKTIRGGVKETKLPVGY